MEDLSSGIDKSFLCAMVARAQATDVSCQEHMNKNGKGGYQMKIPNGFLITLLACGLAASTMIHARNDGANTQPDPARDWSDLIASMDKMQMATGAIAPSGNSDIDFAKLMLPHHQAAVDMARAQLQHGRDPEMRRLAQKILADQQSELRFMQGWLKQRQAPKAEIKPTDRANPAKADLL